MKNKFHFSCLCFLIYLVLYGLMTKICLFLAPSANRVVVTITWAMIRKFVKLGGF